jgi:hypothetical protein
MPMTPLAPQTGPASGLAPTNLVQGLNAGAGMSPGSGAVPPPPPVTPPSAPPSPPSPQTAPAAGTGDWNSPLPPENPTAAQAVPPAYHPPPEPPMPAQPTAPNPGPASTPPPAGSLPAYGSDLRPVASSTPASPLNPPPSAPATSPISPATNAAAGSGGVNQAAAAVRHGPASAPQPAPIGIGARAVAASAAGAVTGAVSADATTRIRLQRLVDTVARQQPRLAWAAGDSPDDITVLVTDLASGWIPPRIEIPSAVTLLGPGRRRGDLQTLLGEVTASASHVPDRYIPEADEAVPTSLRPRRAPEIEELGWELNRATHWRDGLPRLAHTLARAAFSGTGVLDSEVDLLREHLDTVAERVLDAYPEDVDSEEIGNWQLLAAIEALVDGDKIGANYHLAWFQACTTSVAAELA